MGTELQLSKAQKAEYVEDYLDDRGIEASDFFLAHLEEERWMVYEEKGFVNVIDEEGIYDPEVLPKESFLDSLSTHNGRIHSVTAEDTGTIYDVHINQAWIQSDKVIERVENWR